MEYDSPVLMLGDGLYWHKKSYKGKIKDRLKNPQKIQGSERFITRDPQEFLDFLLGPGHNADEVKTFEKLFSLITSSSPLKDKLPEIKENYIRYITKAGLPVPIEMNQID